MMGHVGNPPWYHYRGPVSLNMSIITIFLDPSRSKIGKISKNHVFCVFLWFKKGLKLVLHLHNSPYSMRLKQTWPYVIVLYTAVATKIHTHLSVVIRVISFKLGMTFFLLYMKIYFFPYLNTICNT